MLSNRDLGHVDSAARFAGAAAMYHETGHFTGLEGAHDER
jgi:hypothetical protein